MTSQDNLKKQRQPMNHNQPMSPDEWKDLISVCKAIFDPQNIHWGVSLFPQGVGVFLVSDQTEFTCPFVKSLENLVRVEIWEDDEFPLTSDQQAYQEAQNIVKVLRDKECFTSCEWDWNQQRIIINPSLNATFPASAMYLYKSWCRAVQRGAIQLNAPIDHISLMAL
jgi:hypothetical protein